jgi:glycosyltransferase involved in cell wall biosynthesis
MPAILYKIRNKGRCRVVFTFLTEKQEPFSSFSKMVMQWLLSRCDVVTGITQSVVDSYEKYLKINAEKRVVHGASSIVAPTSDEIKAFSVKYLPKKPSLTLATVSVLSWENKVNGLTVLIKSMTHIIKEVPDAKLLVVGGGRLMPMVEECVKERGLSANVVLCGRLERVEPAILQADIFAHISLQDGLPLTVLEAMEMGKPIVCNAVGGLPEVITNKENGIIVDLQEEAIAAAILKLSKDAETMTSLSKNAQATIRDKLNWQKIANDFLGIYGL